MKLWRVALCLLVLSGAAWSEPVSLLDQARDAIAEGRLNDAAAALAAVDPKTVDPNDLDFLAGTLALRRGDNKGAAEHFRAVLARDPTILRVRLDLARALFFDGDDEGAAYHFRLAQAAGLPPEVQSNVDRFLGEIRRRRHWTLDVLAGIAPDNNINAATVTKTVNLFGIPFQLDQNAQKSSGIGFVGAVSGGYQFDLDADRRLVVGAAANDLDYEGNRFDDRSAGVFIGPRFILSGDAEVTVKAEANRRWYAGRPYSWGAGGRIEAEYALSPRILMSGWFDGQQVTYTQIALDDGPVFSTGMALTYGLDQASFVRGDFTLLREQTSDPAFADFQYIPGISYYRDLPAGFGVLVGANADWARYDKPLFVFGTTRRDSSASFRLGISNKRISWLGITPTITYVHTNRFSDIPLYAFERDRAEFSLNRSF